MTLNSDGYFEADEYFDVEGEEDCECECFACEGGDHEFCESGYCDIS